MDRYQIRLINAHGDWIMETSADTKKAAIAKAKYLLTDKYADDCVTTHDRLETEKVEIHDVLLRSGISCIWDRCREASA
jgi:hypothetical protein